MSAVQTYCNLSSMKKPAIPSNEKQRQAAVESYSILDSAPEIAYEDIVSLASAICGVPIALVTLIDKDRQWFKAKKGIDATESSRDISFCGHAIHNSNVFEVDDASLDERFADNPLVEGGPRIRFYAGAPLIDSQGYALGTLCVIDNEPKKLSAEQIEALEALARQVTRNIETRKWAETIKIQQSQLVQSGRMAALGQMAGGIAHEINSPLGSLALGLGMLEDRLNESEKIEISRLNRAVFQISKIIKNLLSFTGDSEKEEFINTDIRVCVEDCLSFCSEKFKNSEIEIIIDPSLTSKTQILKIQSTNVVKAMLSVLNNSFDAVSEVDTKKWVKLSLLDHAQEIQILISDSGKKIPDDVADKMMEPFFTTKIVGKGAGLGLSFAKGIMEKHSGRLDYLSHKPNTTFALCFPKIL